MRRTLITSAALAVIVLIAGDLAATRLLVPRYKDTSAVGLMSAEKHGGTLDVSEADTIIFGSYEQDNNSENGKEDIE